MLDSCRQHPGEVVTDHEHYKCIQEAVKTAEEPAQETTQACEHPFNLVDHILHNSVLSARIRAIKIDSRSCPLIWIVYKNTDKPWDLIIGSWQSPHWH